MGKPKIQNLEVLMKALLDYALALDNEDAQGIATLFSEHCYFSDGALRRMGRSDIEVRHSGDLAGVFTTLFSQYSFSVEIKQMLPHAMIYIVRLNGEAFPCIGCATLDGEGRISEYIIRPL